MKWIRIEDELPPMDEPVLVWDPEYESFEKAIRMVGAWIVIPIGQPCYPTHWMRIELPKEVIK